MNKKVAKLAKKLHDDFNDNLQDIFTELMKVMSDNKDYFSLVSPEDIIKVVYYIYSLNKTGTFDLGEKIISELHLAQFFKYSKQDQHMEECDDCSGDGRMECSYCDGIGQIRCDDCDDGMVECSECDSEGEVQCGECDGKGEIETEDGTEPCEECQGGGLVRCEECGGRGETSCNTCGGDGYENCSDCNSSGNEECSWCQGEGERWGGSDYDYTIEEWLVFDSTLVNYLYKEYKDGEPIGESLEFAKRPTSLLISSRKEYGEFDESVKQNSYYCFKISRLGEDKLHFENYGTSLIRGVTTYEEPDTLLI